MMKVKIYSARKQRNQKIWHEMVTDLISSRELIWRLMLRDFSVRYRQSFLGYIWAIVPQLMTVAIFTYLAKHRVFSMGETTMPYVLHALWSISVWQLFSGCLVQCTNSLVNASSLITKINFPKEALVFSAVGRAIFDFLIRLIPVTVVFIWYGFVPSWHSVLIPGVLISVILMALGLGFILAIVNLILRDVGNAISMILTFGMFLSPILYPPPVREPFTVVNYANPFSPLLIATQNLLSGQTLMQPELLAIIIVISLCVFLIGWRIFHVTISKITERA